jgi:hypothetical protein
MNTTETRVPQYHLVPEPCIRKLLLCAHRLMKAILVCYSEGLNMAYSACRQLCAPPAGRMKKIMKASGVGAKKSDKSSNGRPKLPGRRSRAAAR